ncbi:SPOSA6832_04303 [Sporobolomyces salmonicolor]|uniref:SPOSA6832_04303-mRNA-1:cds n=1 Tax=Sporidiobolus salmonicolor TaxID=5005 RepID=A0A0D6ESB5_SPOSA|nr:SPOSA6832_04303 [Sporobolomyces salmonicolor]
MSNNSNTAGDDWRYYAYSPSKVLAGVAIGLFGVAFIAHMFLLMRKRCWYMIPFTIAMIGECVGYGIRILSADHPTGRHAGLTFYIIQQLCFGRLILYVGEKWSPVSSKWVTAIFVTFDVVSFVVQGAGGSLYSSDNTNIYPAAKAILVVGFLIQIISFGLFAIFAVIYQIRARRAGVPEGKWTICLYTLYTGTVLILCVVLSSIGSGLRPNCRSPVEIALSIRGIFRTIEFGTGQGNGKGYLLSREGYSLRISLLPLNPFASRRCCDYGLETLPIVLCGYIFIASYPGRYIPHKRGERLASAEAVEVGLIATNDEEAGRALASNNESGCFGGEKTEVEGVVLAPVVAGATAEKGSRWNTWASWGRPRST